MGYNNGPDLSAVVMFHKSVGRIGGASDCPRLRFCQLTDIVRVTNFAFVLHCISRSAAKILLDDNFIQ